MTRCLSMTLFVTLLSAKVVWAGVIADGLPYPNTASVLSLSPTESVASATDRDSRHAPVDVRSVSEPATIALLGIALLLLAASAQRRLQRPVRRQDNVAPKTR